MYRTAECESGDTFCWGTHASDESLDVWCLIVYLTPYMVNFSLPYCSLIAEGCSVRSFAADSIAKERKTMARVPKRVVCAARRFRAHGRWTCRKSWIRCSLELPLNKIFTDRYVSTHAT